MGTFREFPLGPDGQCPRGHPFWITSGPDGNLWFTENGTEPGATSSLSCPAIGRITPTGVVSVFPLPVSRISPLPVPAFLLPLLITSGPDGNLWFTDFAGKIGRITPTGTIRAFPLPASHGFLGSITSGPDGNLWFTEQAVNGQNSKIGRITPTGTIREFSLPTADIPSDAFSTITTGPDGALWFVAEHSGKVWRITPTGMVSTFALPDYSPQSITTSRQENKKNMQSGDT